MPTNPLVPLVIYHYPCLDGFTAAWACWKAHPDWEFYPAKHGDPPPDVTGRVVFFLDFSYKRPVILEMAKQAVFITILDHHKTAEADLVDLPLNVVVTFDMEKSGARLAWEHFHAPKSVPSMVKYVEDRDLWRFQYPQTKAVNAWMFSLTYDFGTWNQAEDSIYFRTSSVAMAGQAILDKQDKDVLELSNNKFYGNIGGYRVPIVNVPYTLASDMGHLLCKEEPFAATCFYDGTGFSYSLRSSEDGVDVSEIAKQYGGGGHKHAAGFKIKIDSKLLGGE